MRLRTVAKTFEGVRSLQAQAEKASKWNRFASTPDSLVLSAWQNADDTMREQGKEPIANAEWVELFFASLVCLLSDLGTEWPNRSIRGWFERRGVRC